MTGTGDEELAGRLDDMVRGQAPVAAAFLSPRGTAVASRSAGPDADFEIGSVSKGLTGLLYADALSRGEITLRTSLGDLLPVRRRDVAEVTLAGLSTHRSGLPRLPRSAHALRRTLRLWRNGTNPYGEDLTELLAQTDAVVVGRPRPRYSNLGFELLGHALAAAAGSSYPELLGRRIAEPLGLQDTYVPATPQQLRPTALTGRTRSGRTREPWTGEALGPAGGIRSSIRDMARLTAALLEGSAPGIAALDPVAAFGPGARIGAAWITIEVRGQPVVWHNGGTGGFRSWLGLNRATGTGAVVLSAASASVDRPGFSLLMTPG